MTLAFAFGACLGPNLTMTGPLASLSDVWCVAIRLLLRGGGVITVIILPQKEDSFKDSDSVSRDLGAFRHVDLPLFANCSCIQA